MERAAVAWRLFRHFAQSTHYWWWAAMQCSTMTASMIFSLAVLDIETSGLRIATRCIDRCAWDLRSKLQQQRCAPPAACFQGLSNASSCTTRLMDTFTYRLLLLIKCLVKNMYKQHRCGTWTTARHRGSSEFPTALQWHLTLETLYAELCGALQLKTYSSRRLT